MPGFGCPGWILIGNFILESERSEQESSAVSIQLTSKLPVSVQVILVISSTTAKWTMECAWCDSAAACHRLPFANFGLWRCSIVPLSGLLDAGCLKLTRMLHSSTAFTRIGNLFHFHLHAASRVRPARDIDPRGRRLSRAAVVSPGQRHRR